VTTQFNLEGKLKSIRVTLADGRKFDAVLKGFNARYDAALLKIGAEKLPTLQKAPLGPLKTGQLVLALGRAPDGRGLTANPGIVSAPWRLDGRGIQIDARVNYGNVGGPVVDREGRLIGITCKVDTKYAASTGQNSGVGFAVTWNKLDEILPDLKMGKSVTENRRPFLGVEANTESEAIGAEIRAIQPATAAEKAGLKAGDIIVELDGKPVRNFAELKAEILKKHAGDKVKIKYQRNGEERSVEAELGWALGD
jgi:S1-C subfamily serine protease